MPLSITMEEIEVMPVGEFNSLVKSVIDNLIGTASSGDTGEDAAYLAKVLSRLLKRSEQLSEIKSATSMKTIATVLEEVDV